jgi:hypothetical protein
MPKIKRTPRVAEWDLHAAQDHTNHRRLSSKPWAWMVTHWPDIGEFLCLPCGRGRCDAVDGQTGKAPNIFRIKLDDRDDDLQELKMTPHV